MPLDLRTNSVERCVGRLELVAGILQRADLRQELVEQLLVLGDFVPPGQGQEVRAAAQLAYQHAALVAYPLGIDVLVAGSRPG